MQQRSMSDDRNVDSKVVRARKKERMSIVSESVRTGPPQRREHTLTQSRAHSRSALMCTYRPPRAQPTHVHMQHGHVAKEFCLLDESCLNGHQTPPQLHSCLSQKPCACLLPLLHHCPSSHPCVLGPTISLPLPPPPSHPPFPFSPSFLLRRIAG